MTAEGTVQASERLHQGPSSPSPATAYAPTAAIPEPVVSGYPNTKPNAPEPHASAAAAPSSLNAEQQQRAETNTGTSGEDATIHADHGANKQPDRKESATKKTRVALGAKLTTNRLSVPRRGPK